ncbi:hypothetical protein ACFJIW_00285 [Tahibacter sp. UC22_41]|uniref:hypothetical protein n=1 Tax=Tahibacter sp. UC22_41 TaxID=3350178 RepID=UPI0036DBD113
MRVRPFLCVTAALALTVGPALAQRQLPQWSAAVDGNGYPHVIGAPAQPGQGVLANVSQRAVSFTPEGGLRWSLWLCPECAGNALLRPRILAVDLLADGSAWLLAAYPARDGDDARYELVLVAADGTVLHRAVMPAWPGLPRSPVLRSTATQALALIPAPGGLRWLRSVAGESAVATQLVELPGNFDTVTITNSRLWPNGSLSVALYTANVAACQFNPPTANCRPAAFTLLRLNADGSERWRVNAGSGQVFIGFDDDSSSLIAQNGGTTLQLRQVGANGVPGAAFAAADGETLTMTGAAGPVGGRYLAAAANEYVLLDRDGRVLARRPFATAAGPALTNGAYGFVTPAWYSDAALVSADDLATLAVFDVDGIDNTDWEAPANLFWSLLSDGSLYTNARGNGDTAAPQRWRISRFAVPGSPASDLIFAHHFD